MLPRRRPDLLSAVLSCGARALELGGRGLRKFFLLLLKEMGESEKEVSKAFFFPTLVNLGLEEE